jgi:hypothetical protein
LRRCIRHIRGDNLSHLGGWGKRPLRAPARSPGFQPGVRGPDLVVAPLQGRGHGRREECRSCRGAPVGGLGRPAPAVAPEGASGMGGRRNPGLKPGSTGPRPQGAPPPNLPRRDVCNNMRSPDASGRTRRVGWGRAVATR